LAALGRPGYINLGHRDDLEQNYDVDAMRDRAHAVLDTAWEAGVRYFDTARSYGKAEQFLASWLRAREIAPTAVSVASKWGYTYTADWRVQVPDGQSHEVKRHSVERLNEQFGESTEQFGPQLDLYQVHSATLESGVLSNNAVLDRLAELRDSGLRIGLSVSGAAQADIIRTAIECERGGNQVFSAVQATWNLMETSAGAALQEANDQGWTVIVKEGVANGRLTSRNQDPSFDPKKQKLQPIADSFGVSIDAVALAAILKQPWMTIVLSGAATSDHLLSNLNAVSVANQLENCDVQKLFGALTESPEGYWSSRSKLSWN
jgi:aryl-alcohol dehydrogenase-like predicted oxidoreductase